MTASAFCSLSIDPPLVLVCVKKNGAMHERLTEADGFGVNLLDRSQETVSNRFAGWWNKEESKWADLDVRRAPVSKAAWIGGSLASLDCSVHDRLDGGDHTIFIGKVENIDVDDRSRDSLEPLLYFAGQYRSVAERTT